MKTLQTIRRATRLATLSTAMPALRKQSNEQVRRSAQEHIAARLGRLHGLPQKVGQLFSFSMQDKGETQNAFEQLQNKSEQLPLHDLLPVLEATWRSSADDVVEHIEPQAQAASLGQVHRATLQDGSDVAIKIQYPGIPEAVTDDLRVTGWLSRPLKWTGTGFDLDAYRQTLHETLKTELDYRVESERHQRFTDIGRSHPVIVVPQPLLDLCGERVLVTQWEGGRSLDNAVSQWSPAWKRAAADGLLNFFLDGLFSHGQMQADWHPGNLSFRDSAGRAEIVLYDLGCLVELSRVQRLTLARLIQATIHGSESPWPLFLALGFDRELLEPMAGKLPALCRVLFEPFCCEYAYDMRDWKLSERVSAVLGNDRWNFRMASPASLFLLLRAFHGLSYYLHRFAEPVLWRRAFEKWTRPLQPQIDSLQPVHPSMDECSFGNVAQYLKIRVREGMETKVELTQHARRIESLDEMLGTEQRRKIQQRGVSLAQLVDEVRNSGYQPGVIFELNEGTKQIKIWLE